MITTVIIASFRSKLPRKTFIIQGFKRFCRGSVMPIYAYRCEACGFAKDVLQKISDPQLTDCPTCGKASFKKQVTAAGFQLKGTGWYATDFRGGAGTSAPPVTPAEAAGKAADGAAASAATSATTPAATSVAPSTKSGTGSATPSAN